MSAELFQPIGEQSRREIVLQLLTAADYGDVASYDTLADALGGVDRATIHAAVAAAKPALEREHNKAVVALHNQGYRIVSPNEHMGLAVQHQRKSRRSLQRSLSKVKYVDVSQLTEGERAAIILAATSLSMMLEYQRRNDIRHARHEEQLEAVKSKSDRSEEELADLRRRLEALENREA